MARAEHSELGALGPSIVTRYNVSDMESADKGSRLATSESTANPAQADVGSQTQKRGPAEDAWSAERSSHPRSSSTVPKEGIANPQTLGKRASCTTVEEYRTKYRRTDPFSLDFRASSQRMYHVGCVFMVKSKFRRETVPVGEPFRAPNGWSALLSIEAGQNRLLFVVHDIRINNGRKDRPVSNEPSQRIEFSVVWRPKVPVKKDLMIDELDLQRNLDVKLSFLLHHPTLFNKCPPEKQHKLQKLMSMAFASNSSTTTDFDKSGWEDLHKDVQHGYESLLFADGPLTVGILFHWIP
ncbi:hypothetical protein ABVK25_008699 [Lepraria finkii]|uniref:Uncharacterized protein n=1 Tax=Lepraria finkii TaxID=1340010 RepID=A0ABR4B0L0_9LECA